MPTVQAPSPTRWIGTEPPAPGPRPQQPRQANWISEPMATDWALAATGDGQAAEFDSSLADAGRCGQIERRSGFRCVAIERHLGSCQFVGWHTAAQVLEYYQHTAGQAPTRT